MADEQENEQTLEQNDKDDLYREPKPRQKFIRILTVLAYILSVSMAAILLSVYYVFMWDGQPTLARRTGINEYNYAEQYQENLENGTPVTYVNSEELFSQKNTFSDESSISHNFTDYPTRLHKITEYQIVSDNSPLLASNVVAEKRLEQPTEMYDIYAFASTNTPTEDNLMDINEGLEDSTISNSMNIRNKIFYSKYLYKKLRMS